MFKIMTKDHKVAITYVNAKGGYDYAVASSPAAKTLLTQLGAWAAIDRIKRLNPAGATCLEVVVTP